MDILAAGTKVKVKKFDQDGKEDGWEYINAAIDARKGKLARQLGRVNQSYENNETNMDYNIKGLVFLFHIVLLTEVLYVLKVRMRKMK